MAADGIVILRLVLAAVLGGLVGLEREVNGREAGVRTYLLVSLGSALIMILSQYLAFGLTGNEGAVRVDPGRIAAQAVTGIGFLGAGVIIRYGNSIRGLTTAACMWVTCAVGLSIGAGYYLYGTVVSVITLAALVGLKVASRRLPIDWYRDLVVVLEDREGQFERVQKAVEENGARISSFSLRRDRLGQELRLTFRIRFRARGSLDRSVVNSVYEVPGIKTVELT